MAELWPWLVLAGLGAYHGLNPGMGWLFAVALGLQRDDRSAMVVALVPIALGHALSITTVAVLVVLAGVVIERAAVQAVAGGLLLAWALVHAWRGSRHRVRFGMRVGLLGLGAWSFLTATSHGAGLMLVPALIPLCLADTPARALVAAGSLEVALLAIAVHTAAMLAVTLGVALLVHDWLGIGVLRRGWLDLDRLWSMALVATGLLLLLLAGL